MTSQDFTVKTPTDAQRLGAAGQILAEIAFDLRSAFSTLQAAAAAGESDEKDGINRCAAAMVARAASLADNAAELLGEPRAVQPGHWLQSPFAQMALEDLRTTAEQAA